MTPKYMTIKKKQRVQPWLVWLSGLNAGLQTKGLLVQFPVQGTRLDCGPGPQQGARERQPHIDVSVPPSFLSPLSKNK